MRGGSAVDTFAVCWLTTKNRDPYASPTDDEEEKKRNSGKRKVQICRDDCSGFTQAPLRQGAVVDLRERYGTDPRQAQGTDAAAGCGGPRYLGRMSGHGAFPFPGFPSFSFLSLASAVIWVAIFSGQ